MTPNDITQAVERVEKLNVAARDLRDRLRGKYACGPIMAAGEPEFGYRIFKTMPDGSPFPAIHGEAADMIDTLLSHTTRLESELKAALREVSSYAREAGEAKGRLEMSEAAGIVDGWRERAEAAEAHVARLESENERLRELCERSREELRLIRAKDSNAVYDTMLRTELNLALGTSQAGASEQQSEGR